MRDTGLRRRLKSLIAIRPSSARSCSGRDAASDYGAGSFAIDPGVFAFIGLTYALTIGYAITLRYADAHRWLVDVQLSGTPSSFRIHLCHRRDHQLLFGPLRPAYRRRPTSCSSGGAACWWRP